MEFIHSPYQPGETIAAIATPPGEGGVAIIRISGKESLDIAAKIFSGPVYTYQSHTVHYGHIIDASGARVDDVLLLVLLGLRSFTGENTVEIHCHGGSLITRKVLEVVLQAGARPARPGEFSLKAFMNGKLDLTQAEAIQELISAKNEHALEAAENQLSGRLSKKINEFQKNLTDIAAILEAWIDFPEEGLEFASLEEICSHLHDVAMQMEHLLSTFHNGKMIHDGITMCLIGCPNAGKSSLMNALLAKDRAIVSHIPGTTRDVLEDHLHLNGLNFKLMDTAGIRQASDLIEQEGIRRSKDAMHGADLILLVLDVVKGIDEEDLHLMNLVPKQKTIAIWNKCDLPHNGMPILDFDHVVAISAKQGIGLDLLHQKIDEVIWHKGPPSKEEIVITNVRHKRSLEGALQACNMLIQGLQTGASPEFLSLDMRHCLSELGAIIGTNITEDILSAIFSKFCIGK